MKNKFVLFIEKLLSTFAVIIMVFMILAFFIGDGAKEKSSLFSLGNQGLSLSTLIQLFALSLAVCLLNVIFLTDTFLKNMGVVLRYVLFFILTMAVLASFSIMFHWIPNKIKYWLGVFVCFLVSTITSIFVSKLLSKREDEKLNSALKAIKMKENS
ncbi:MAG: hypothetical protein J6Y16_04180 [Treponema sp.]|nr:hypothetical protein [Treponema sp.]